MTTASDIYNQKETMKVIGVSKKEALASGVIVNAIGSETT